MTGAVLSCSFVLSFLVMLHASVVMADPYPPVLSGTLGIAGRNFYYEASPEVSGGYPPFEFLVEGELPRGLTLETSTGLISGTPTTSGVYSMTVTINDSWGPGRSDTRAYVIEVRNMPLDIITQSVHNGSAGYLYRSTVFKYAASSSDTAMWRLESGDLPPGLSLNVVGDDYVLSGTPTTPGTYEFSITVTKGEESQTNAYKVLIDDREFAPWFRAASDPATFPYGDTEASIGHLFIEPGTSTPFPPSDNVAIPVENLTAAVGNGKIYVCGGWSDITVNTDGDDPRYWFNRQSHFSIYDPVKDEWDSAYWKDWSALSYSTGYQDNGQPTGYNNAGHLGIGGTAKPTIDMGTLTGPNHSWTYDYDDDGTEEFFVYGGYPIWSNTIAIYDPDTNGWTSSGQGPGDVFYFGLCRNNGHMVYCTWQDRLLIYDMSADVWTEEEIPDSMFHMSFHGGEIVGNKLYLFGGDTGDGVRTIVYDLGGGYWTTLTDMPIGAYLPCSFIDRHLIYVFGGKSDSDGWDNVQVYDTDTGAWTLSFLDMPYGMSRGGCAFWNEYMIYLIYGRATTIDAGVATSRKTNEVFGANCFMIADCRILDMAHTPSGIELTMSIPPGGDCGIESSTSEYSSDHTNMVWEEKARAIGCLEPQTWVDTDATPDGHTFYRLVLH